MKVRRLPSEDIISIARMVEVEVDEDETYEEDLAAGVYAVDSQGNIWVRMDIMTRLVRELLRD